jgi:GT2 family glycosyltransferase
MPFIDAHLQSLRAQHYPNTTIVVVDNGSRDGTTERLSLILPEDATLIKNPDNLGCAAGYNQGADACGRADIVCFLNQDTVLQPDFCSAIVARFVADHGCVAIQPLVKFLSNPQVVENCGHVVDAWMTTATVGHRMPYGSMRIPYGLMFTLTAPAIRRTEFGRLGGFDESLFVYYEDTDLSLRIWQSGGRVAFEPSAVVYHVQAGSKEYFSDAWRSFLYARNRIRLLWKHGDGLTGRARAVAALAGGMGIGLVLLPVEPSKGLAILRAVGWNIRHVRANESARRSVQKDRSYALSSLVKAGVVGRPRGPMRVLARAIRPIRVYDSHL